VALATSCGGDREPSRADPADGGQAACGVWRAGPALMSQRESAPTFLVEGGLVLAVSGHFDNRTRDPVDTSELVDATGGVSRLTGTFNVPHSTSGPGATVQVLDGRVLSGTPWNWSDQPVLPAEIWDPATGAWSVKGCARAAADSRSGLVIGCARK
jgi:hypothetical protein